MRRFEDAWLCLHPADPARLSRELRPVPTGSLFPIGFRAPGAPNGGMPLDTERNIV
jgi:hypothetical protein